jgi:hypothetical protein
MTFTKNGKIMAVLAKDRKIRLFNFLTGKITQTIDESLDSYSALQQVQFVSKKFNGLFFTTHFNFCLKELATIEQHGIRPTFGHREGHREK